MKRTRPPSNSTSTDPWESLRDSAESVLLANFHTTILPAAPPFNSTNVSFSYPVPCQNVTSVQESTSSLLSARAYAKAGWIRRAWLSMDSLLSLQATNGLLPKFLYYSNSSFNHNNNHNNSSPHYFINHTGIPNWTLFQNYTNPQYQPPNTSLATRAGAQTSRRISAIPFHASLLLETFYLSNKTSTDLLQMQRHFDRLYRQHDFIHSVVMRGCHDLTGRSNNNTSYIVPWYNVVHPWETLLPDHHPNSFSLWNEALNQTTRLMQQSNWTFPAAGDHSSYHDEASLFLLECQSQAMAKSHCTTSLECEDALIQHCPFGVLDVGYTAALVQSNSDLLTMAHIILMDARHYIVDKDTTRRAMALKIRQLQLWKEQSRHIMETYLWNQEYQTYSSRFIVFEPVGTTNDDNSTTAMTRFVPIESKFLDSIAVSSNFMSLWVSTLNESRRDSMTFHLMQKRGKYSFDCGQYPLVSIGGCDDTNATNKATVSPLMNYLVTRGLQRNNASGLSHYLSNSTLNLVCGLPNQAIHPFSNDSSRQYCPTDGGVHFWNDYNGTTGLPLTLHPVCGETVSAAAIYNFLLADPPFDYIPSRPPPIQSNWVIAIVVAELVIAFVIGVSCILLNVTLLRRVNDDETSGDALFGSVRQRDSDGANFHYFSAEASLEEELDDDEGT